MLVLSGIGQACTGVALYPLLTQLVPKEEIGFFTGLQATANSLSQPLVIVVAGSLVNAGSYRAVFAVCIAAMFAAIPLIAKIDILAANREISEATAA
jgi:MFS family permease